MNSYLEKGLFSQKSLYQNDNIIYLSNFGWWAGGLENNSLETRQSFLPMSQMKQEGEFTTNLQLMDSHPQLMDLPPTVIDRMFLLKQQSTIKWTNPNNKPTTTNPGGQAGVVVCVSHFESRILYYKKYSVFNKDYVIQERKRNFWPIHWKISLEEAQIWDLLGKHFNLSTINMFKELKEFMKMMSQQIENINKNIQTTRKNQIKYWSLKV